MDFRVWLFALLLCVGFAGLRAQDDDSPPPKPQGMRITFLPPPIEGVWSLGIFDKSGKLVRALHTEATTENFVVGLNGLITFWDGKNDQGKDMPAGKYLVRGFAIGGFEVDGVAFHCNDWADDEDLPRVASVNGLRMGPADTLLVQAKSPAGEAVTLRIDKDGSASVPTEGDPEYKPNAAVGAANMIPVLEPLVEKDGALSAPEEKTLEIGLPGLEKPLMACRGKNGSVWVIDRVGAGVEIKEYSAEKELIRRLAIAEAEPVPVQIAASTQREAIFLLERAPGVEQVRGLVLEPAEEKEIADKEKAPASGDTNAGPAKEETKMVWKTVFSKRIEANDTFEKANPNLDREKPLVPDAKVRVRLLPNPLFQDAMHEVDIRIQVDDKGAYFQTMDGLPLRHLTETEHLKWAVIARDGAKAVTLLQSDGAVVEEFRVSRLANMMAFDAGEYRWTPKEKTGDRKPETGK